MQEDLTIRPGLVIPGHELDVEASVGGGPGGQQPPGNTTPLVNLIFSETDNPKSPGSYIPSARPVCSQSARMAGARKRLRNNSGSR